MKMKIKRKFRTYDRRSMGLEIQKQSEMILAMGEQVDALQAVLRQNAKTNKEILEAHQRKIEDLKRQQELWQKAASEYSQRLSTIRQIAQTARDLAFDEAEEPWWRLPKRRMALRDCIENFQQINVACINGRGAVVSSLKKLVAKG